MSTPVTTPFIQYDCENPRRDAPPFWIYQEKLRSGTVIFAPLNDRAFVKSCKCQLIGIFIFSRVIKHCSGRGTSIDPFALMSFAAINFLSAMFKGKLIATIIDSLYSTVYIYVKAERRVFLMT